MNWGNTLLSCCRYCFYCFFVYCFFVSTVSTVCSLRNSIQVWFELLLIAYVSNSDRVVYLLDLGLCLKLKFDITAFR